MSLHPYVMDALLCASFYQTHNYSTTIYGGLLYRISSETAKNIEIGLKMHLRKQLKYGRQCADCHAARTDRPSHILSRTAASSSLNSRQTVQSPIGDHGRTDGRGQQQKKALFLPLLIECYKIAVLLSEELTLKKTEFCNSMAICSHGISLRMLFQHNSVTVSCCQLCQQKYLL